MRASIRLHRNSDVDTDPDPGALSHANVPIEKSPSIQKELEISEEQAVQFLRSRRSVRFFKKQPVEKETLQRLIEIARYAPTGGNVQMVEWMVFTEAERIKEIAGRTVGWMRKVMEKAPQMAPPYFPLMIGAWDMGYNSVTWSAPVLIVASAPKEATTGMTDVSLALCYFEMAARKLGLGTCWLGGTFRRSNFAARVQAGEDETLAAAVAVGVIADRVSWVDRVFRKGAGSARRLAWEQLYFDGGFGAPLSREAAGAYAPVLEMARRAPSASNKQPWRILRLGNCWHFYMQRTKGYREMAINRFTGIADMQRIDMGIAMCHFEMTAQELGLAGHWELQGPHLVQTLEYSITWIEGA